MEKKVTLFFLCFSLILVHAYATNYYVAANGNDNDNGTSVSTPFQTIAKINSLTLQAGDQILFRRGDTFRGQLNITQSGTPGNPIIIDAYGTGDAPVISGSALVTGWTNTNGNIWQADFSQGGTAVTGVYINGSALPLGRWPNANTPNKGYLTINSHVNNAQLTSSSLSGAPTANWTGGEAVIRAAHWIINRVSISSSTSNSLNFTNYTSSYGIPDGWGFFIQGHPATLDQNGEWYYDPNAKKISLFSLGNPNNQVIEATAFSSCITITNQNYITITNLTLAGGLEKNLNVNGSSNITFQNSKSINAGTNSIAFADGNNILIQQDSILNTNNNAIYIQTIDGLTCQNNYIKNTALIAGSGNSGDQQYFALQVNGYGTNPSTDVTIQNNVIDSTGYTAINFFGYNNVLIKNNFINHYDLVKDDGGGIYTYSGATNTAVYTNRKIIDNIVLNAVGSFEGTNSNGSYLPAEGIYMDDNVGNVEITGNTVAHCSNSGIFFHNAHNINLNHNTVFDANKQLQLNHDNTVASQAIRNCTINANIFFAKTPAQLVADIETQVNDINTFGTFDSNYYCRPFDERLSIYTSTSIATTSYDLAGWKSAYGKDAVSKITPVQFALYAVNNFTGSSLFSNGAFNSNLNGLYCYSPSSDCATTWDNSGKLDGGSLKLSPGTSNPTFLIIGIGAVSASQNYILKFSLVGTNAGKTIGIFLRQSGPPYQNLTPTSYCLLNTNRTENEFLFSAPATESDASIVFAVNADAGSFWVDNISLQKANVTIANPDDSIRFEYNATQAPKNISLSSNYVDVKGNIHSGSLILQPFTSIILLKTNAAVLPLTLLEFNGNLIHNNALLNWKVNNEVNTESFDIERSIDGKTFTKIGNVIAVNRPGDQKYEFTDYNLNLIGVTIIYYRLKQKDIDGRFAYSKIIALQIDYNNFNILFYPNPVTNEATLAITINQAVQLEGRVFDNTGRLVKIQQWNLSAGSSSLPVDIQGLSKGIYYLELKGGAINERKRFVKQ